MIQNDSTFLIKEENKLKALTALKKTINQKGKMTGETNGQKVFSYVDMDYTKADTLEKSLECWRWEAKKDLNGNIINIKFLGENLGDDIVMFKSIAPFIENDSLIELTIEDKYKRFLYIIEFWSFNTGKLTIKKIVLDADVLINEHIELMRENSNYKLHEKHTSLSQDPEIYKRIKAKILNGTYKNII